MKKYLWIKADTAYGLEKKVHTYVLEGYKLVTAYFEPFSSFAGRNGDHVAVLEKS